MPQFFPRLLSLLTPVIAESCLYTRTKPRIFPVPAPNTKVTDPMNSFPISRQQLPKMAALFLALFCPSLYSQESRPLRESVQGFVEKQELAGAVMLVANRDKILALETSGWADIGRQKPMQPDSVFWIASQSKPITAAALMVLVDEGKVSLDDPVEKYLPEFRGQMVIAEKDKEHVLLRKLKHPITVRNILAHTSGLPFRSPIEVPTLDRLSLADRVRSYAMLGLDFEPDTKYQYSNAGINTAGRIIEVVSGKSFEDFLNQRLLAPLGMKDTSFWPSEGHIPRIAKAYKPDPKTKELVETQIDQLQYPLGNRSQRTSMPAGGLFSTASDLARFYQMLLNRGQFEGKQILSESSVNALTQRQTPKGLPESYGLGFSVGPTHFGHGGAYSTNTIADTKNGLIFVWLVQHAGFPGDGAKSQDAFRKKAMEQFASPQK